jgi:CRISPR-associated protein Csa3
MHNDATKTHICNGYRISSMKTYITLSGFDTSQIVSLIVKYGIERGDRIILIRPFEEKDSRGESTVQAIKDLSRQIDSSIEVDIHRVNHRDFDGIVISLIELLNDANGEIAVNLSGGPREIFLAFVVACLSQSQRISKSMNFSDIDRAMNEITLPNVVHTPDDRLKRILKDVSDNQPTTITEISQRLKISESTASRQAGELSDIKALDLTQRGKVKDVHITLTGKILLYSRNFKDSPVP